MRETTRKQAIENNLKLVGGITAKDISKVILLIERLKEDKNIKYYIIESIVFNENTHDGEIRVSFWG
jgi:hypothetical protein